MGGGGGGGRRLPLLTNCYFPSLSAAGLRPRAKYEGHSTEIAQRAQSKGLQQYDFVYIFFAALVNVMQRTVPNLLCVVRSHFGSSHVGKSAVQHSSHVMPTRIMSPSAPLLMGSGSVLKHYNDPRHLDAADGAASRVQRPHVAGGASITALAEASNRLLQAPDSLEMTRKVRSVRDVLFFHKSSLPHAEVVFLQHK